VVWADGEPGESTADHWHASFRLTPGTGQVALSRLVDGQPQVVDYLAYAALNPGEGVGSFPDGDPAARQVLYSITPGGPNDNAFPPAPIFINEWMASNTGSVLDPADFDADDWFELYNAGDVPVDLAGYRLSDDALNAGKYVIPAGFQIPARGFLVIWADEEGGQTELSGSLHVNFRLGASGETILVSDPKGRVVDMVSFGPQSANVSEGRYPDGNAGPFAALSIWTPGAANQGPTPVGLVVGSIELDPDAGTATLRWEAQPGRAYRVQYKQSLTDATWLTVPGGDVVGGEKVDDTIAGVSRRYYRLVLLP
jgi:hypothetical protein